MGEFLSGLTGLPPWVCDALIGLFVAGIKLVRADEDKKREEALMEAAESTKKALDVVKFGAG